MTLSSSSSTSAATSAAPTPATPGPPASAEAPARGRAYGQSTARHNRVARRQSERRGAGTGPPRRLVAGTVLTLAVILTAVLPVSRIATGRWWAFGLTVPLVLWGAAPFHQAAWNGLRRGTASLATLVSVSTLAGAGWSLALLVLDDAAATEHWSGRGAGARVLYLPAVAVVTWLALVGRHLGRRSFGDRGGSEGPLTEIRTVAARRSDERAAGERAAGGRVPAVLALLAAVTAGATTGFWLAAGATPQGAGGATAAVLVVACPGGLLLAGPLVAALGAHRGSRLRLGVTDPETLAVAQQVDTVVISTTGPLTTDHPRVLDIATAEGTSVPEVLERVGSLGLCSQRPAIRALVAAAHTCQVRLGRAEIVAESPGLGLRGVVDGQVVAVGGESFLAEWATALPAHLTRTKAAAEAAGRTTLLAGWDGAVHALVVLAEPVRPDAWQAVAELKASGLQPLLLTTGDERERAAAIAGRVGIDDLVAVRSPDETESAVGWLVRRDRVLATVDDRTGGLPGLEGADVEVAYRSGHQACGDGTGASATFRRGADLWSAVDALRFCRAIGHLQRQNRLLSLGLTVPALGLAAAGLVGSLPALAIVAASAVTVGLNSLRILRFQSLRPPGHLAPGE